MTRQPPNDGGWCAQVQSAIGADLRAIRARFVEARTVEVGDPWGPEQICFYAVRDRLVAITCQPRDGQNCLIAPANAALDDYRQWQTLWHALGMDAGADADEGLDAYMKQFPWGFDEFMLFIGSRLRAYFASLSAS